MDSHPELFNGIKKLKYSQVKHHITPTMDDVIHELIGATVFSKLNLKAGYHQLELHQQIFPTFTTHLGLRRYKPLKFGISPAAEVFQNAVRHAKALQV